MRQRRCTWVACIYYWSISYLPTNLPIQSWARSLPLHATPPTNNGNSKSRRGYVDNGQGDGDEEIPHKDGGMVAQGNGDCSRVVG